MVRDHIEREPNFLLWLWSLNIYISGRDKALELNIDLGLPDVWTLSILPYSKEHNVSETDPVSEYRYSNQHNVSETGSVSETLCYLEYGTMDKVQKPSNPVIHHRQNL
jgi:hypothetical protein